MNDVAAHAGVSQTTVSCVLNGRTGAVKIGGETRRRVLDAAQELGYRRDELALAMKSGKSRAIGLAMKTPDVDAEFKARVLDGVLEAGAELDYSIKVIHLPREEDLPKAVESCLKWRAVGLITVSLTPSILDSVRAELNRHEIMTAVIEVPQPSQWGIHLVSDEAQGVNLALHHLKALGHTRIGFLAGEASSEAAQSRTQIFREALLALGLPLREEYIVHGNWLQREANEMAASRLLHLPCPPTAILCTGDPAAVVTYNVARRLGYEIPRDLSLIGFGNYVYSTLVDPQLTTLAQPFQELGKLAVKRIMDGFDRWQNGQPWTDRPSNEILPMRLIERGSTAAPRP